MKIEIKHTITGLEVEVDWYAWKQGDEYIKQGSKEDQEHYEYLKSKIQYESN